MTKEKAAEILDEMDHDTQQYSDYINNNINTVDYTVVCELLRDMLGMTGAAKMRFRHSTYVLYRMMQHLYASRDRLRDDWDDYTMLQFLYKYRKYLEQLLQISKTKVFVAQWLTWARTYYTTADTVVLFDRIDAGQ